MADITVNNHDLLGKMTIIKNCLSLVLENKNPPLDDKTTNLLQTASNANQNLIDKIEALTGLSSGNLNNSSRQS